MSYEIVKSIKIDEKEKTVKIRSTSNNVTPKTYSQWTSTHLSDILKETGKESVIKEIILNYFHGNFQKSHNIYEKCLILIDNKKWNWDTPDNKIEELKDALYSAYLKFNQPPHE